MPYVTNSGLRPIRSFSFRNVEILTQLARARAQALQLFLRAGLHTLWYLTLAFDRQKVLSAR